MEPQAFQAFQVGLSEVQPQLDRLKLGPRDGALRGQ